MAKKNVKSATAPRKNRERSEAVQSRLHEEGLGLELFRQQLTKILVGDFKSFLDWASIADIMFVVRVFDLKFEGDGKKSFVDCVLETLGIRTTELAAQGVSDDFLKKEAHGKMMEALLLLPTKLSKPS